MTLTVLNVAYPLAPVTPESVGGAEQVLAAVDEALDEHGATSIVLACEGSRTRGHLLSTPLPNGLLDEAACVPAREAHAAAIVDALERFPIDVVHLHGLDFHHYLPPAGVPVLATLHLAPGWYPPQAIAPNRPDTFVHCVSEWQRRLCPSSAAMLPTITNGVPIPATPPRPAQSRAPFVVAMGRICPEKGFHIALDAARNAKIGMRLAGRVFPYKVHVDYYESEILPRLGDDRRFIGPLGGVPKQMLLAEARCVLVTSLVPETSSLVAMEAMAAGTPVIAFGKGALPEIIQHGVTGFLVSSAAEMADAITAAGDLDPEACRQAAIERFSISAMKRRYMDRYHGLARKTASGVLRSAPGGGRSAITVHRGRPIRRVLELTEISRSEEFTGLAPEWGELCATAAATPFQRPEWVIPWWQQFGAGELRALTLRRAGELVGLAPLYVRPGADGRRELAFIGTGNSDYVDVIAATDTSAEVATQLADWIAANSSDWDSCDLGPLRASSPLFRCQSPRGWQASRWRWDVCPVVQAGAPRNLVRAVPDALLTRLRHERARLTRKRSFSIERADSESAVASFDVLCELHAARWRARGGTGVIADDRTRRFHTDVVRGMAAADWLRLYVLRLDDRPASAFYGFAHHRRWYCYLGGFHPDFHRHSVGALVILHAIEEAAASDALAFDFLRGAESYKYEWGAVDEAVDGWRLTRSTAARTEEVA